MRRFCLLFLAAALVDAQKLPEPYLSIVELAHSAPPEFAADALLRVVESGKVTDRNARRDLAEQAFRLAGSARFPVRMRGLPGSTVDTRSGYLSQAYDLKLDALSLESRAVHDLLSLDAAKARELFQDIARPQLASLTCDDALVYDVSDFYQTLGAIANTTFTQKERDKEEHVAFLLDYLGQEREVVFGFPVEAECEHAPQGERSVPDPAIAVIPVPLAARGFRERRGGGGSDGLGRR